MDQLTDENIHHLFWTWLDLHTKFLAGAKREEMPEIFLEIMTIISVIEGIEYDQALKLVNHGLFHAGLSLKMGMSLINMVISDRKDLIDKLVVLYRLHHDEDELILLSDDVSENSFTLEFSDNDETSEMNDELPTHDEEHGPDGSVWVIEGYQTRIEECNDDYADFFEEMEFWEAYDDYAPEDFDSFDGKRAPKFSKRHPRPKRVFNQHQQKHLRHRHDEKVRQLGRRCQLILPNVDQIWEEVTTTTPFLMLKTRNGRKKIKPIELPLEFRQQTKLEYLYGVPIGSYYTRFYQTTKFRPRIWDRLSVW